MENWDIPFYRESSTAWESRAPFYEVTTAKHSALKAVNSESFPSLLFSSSSYSSFRERDEARGSERNWRELLLKLRTIRRSQIKISPFLLPSHPSHCLRFIAGKTPPISSGAEETRGEGATQGRPLADLGKANKCEGNRRERGMIISHSSSPRLDLHCRSFRRSHGIYGRRRGTLSFLFNFFRNRASMRSILTLTIIVRKFTSWNELFFFGNVAYEFSLTLNYIFKN